MTKNDSNNKWFKNLLSNKDDKKKRSSPIYYLAIVMCIGLALMIFSNFSKSTSLQDSVPVFKEEAKNTTDAIPVFTGKNTAEGPQTMQDYEYGYEKQLRETLEQIVGVSEVTVMINLAETETKIFERNKTMKEQKTDETDREGGKRKVEDLTKEDEVVVIRTGDKEEPLITKTEKPQIRGVLVVANGVENIQVKTWVVEAVSRVLDVPTHRVSVLPKKSKGE